MTTPVRLLAKSSATPDAPRTAETLSGHLGSVVAAARAALRASDKELLDSMGLAGSVTTADLKAVLLRAAVLHDIGKGNSHFQEAVRHNSPQALRHDWLSGWLVLGCPELGNWLLGSLDGRQRDIVIAAVAGHHLKLSDGSALEWRPGNARPLEVLTQHPDFTACLRLAQKELGLGTPPTLRTVTLNCDDARPLPELRDWLLDYPDLTDPLARLAALVKALLINADATGSALPRQGKEVAGWVHNVLARVCAADDLTAIAEVRLRGARPRPFQVEVAGTSARVTFTRAGCGTGKTVAAYMWAGKRAAGRKLYFCYPTTGTATEGFRDYIIGSDSDRESALLHSRSEVDLEDVLADRTSDPFEQAARYDSLAGMDAALIVCTADQVLGLIQNYRRPLFTFPALGTAAFVFDEVHQYDDRLFGALLRFIAAFPGLPLLLMTASLPRIRLAALEETVVAAGNRLETVNGPAEMEALPRYELSPPQASPPADEIARVLARGGRVLWVTNTVPRAVRFWQMHESCGPLLYHSRYRYCDRVGKHRAVIDRFRTEGGVLAVTTQVCEVSLDISADLLVTDLAPIPALIQRLGRLNRRAGPGSPVCRAVFLEPDTTLPYGEDEFDVVRTADWVRALGGRPVSQRDLADEFEARDPGRRIEGIRSAWLDSGPFSAQQPLREGDHSVSLLLPEDAPHCTDGRGRPVMREVVRRSLPMPLNRNAARAVGGWLRIGSAFAVPEGWVNYSTEKGGEWARKRKQ